MVRVLGELRAMRQDEGLSGTSLRRVMLALDLVQETRLALMVAGDVPFPPTPLPRGKEETK